MTNFSMKALRRMKGSNNSVVILIAAAIVIVAILIALIAFLVMRSGQGPVSKGEAELASFFPENTMMYAELNVTPEKFKELQKISGDSFSLEKIAESIKDAAKSPSESIETITLIKELNKTLEPKFALGLWDMNEVTNNPDKVLLAGIVKDPDNVSTLFEKASEGGVTFSPKTIDGMEFYVSSQENGGGYVVYKNVLLISDKIETLQDAITFHKDGKSNVLSNPKAKEVLDNLQPTRIFTVLINTSAFTNLANKGGSSGNVESFQQFLNTMSYTGIGLDLHSDVLEGKFYAPYSLEGITDPVFKTDLEKVFGASSALNAPEILPEDSVAYVSLSGVSYLFEVSMKFLDPSHKSQYEQTKQMVKMFTGLSLESDIIPLFSDELTLAGRVDGSEVDPIMVITAKDNSMQVLNKIVSSLGTMDPSTTVSDRSVGGSSLKVISSSQSPVDVAYGKIGNVVAMGKASTIETLANAYSNKKTLAKAATYSEMGKYIPEKVSFALYIDYEKLAKAAKVMKAPSDKVKEFEQMSENVSALIFTAGNKENKAIEGSLLVKLKQQ